MGPKTNLSRTLIHKPREGGGEFSLAPRLHDNQCLSENLNLSIYYQVSAAIYKTDFAIYMTDWPSFI